MLRWKPLGRMVCLGRVARGCVVSICLAVASCSVLQWSLLSLPRQGSALSLWLSLASGSVPLIQLWPHGGWGEPGLHEAAVPTELVLLLSGSSEIPDQPP